ncbi:MAG TPA: c(7)-type cytochrome triheme domain-containing protein [Rhodocyclaceae bacterium]
MKFSKLLLVSAIALLAAPLAQAAASGKDVYSKTCALCHATGVAGSPKFGNADDWGPRIARGVSNLYTSALKGTAKGMPAKGGNLTLADGEVKAAVDYMVGAAKGSDAKAPAKAEEAAKAAPVAEKKADAKPAAASNPAAEAKAAASAAAAAPEATGDVNSFNRLLKPANKRNPPPPEDGIHDPTNDGTHALLPPQAAFGSLPKSNAGNRVNWVEALNTDKIHPRYDRNDPKAEPIVMDLNIVREVKGSMPDVVYPHKQHTQWLDCSNCHPAIFIPQKGANSISMAAILLGEKCGVCHGKVAFPVSECRFCHSKKKDTSRPAAATPTAAKQ